MKGERQEELYLSYFSKNKIFQEQEKYQEFPGKRNRNRKSSFIYKVRGDYAIEYVSMANEY